MTALPAGLRRIDVPVPHPGIITATNCYEFEDAEGGIHLVDPGWGHPDARAALEADLSAHGRSLGDIRSLIVTHVHPDHLGLAEQLRAEGVGRLVLARPELAALESWAPMGRDASEYDRWGVPGEARGELPGPAEAPPAPVPPDVLVDDGDRLDIPGFDVRVLVTPGHTVGSMCLVVDDAVILTGDTVLPGINPGLGLGGFAPEDDPIGMALATLDRLAGLGDLPVAPGHGPALPSVATRAGELAARHRERSAEIAALRDGGADTVWAVASRVSWTGGWEAVRGYLRVSALHQTELHLRHLERRA